MNSNLALAAAQKVVFWFWNKREVKELVVSLLERYSKTTDNDIDDVIVKIVRDALLK